MTDFSKYFNCIAHDLGRVEHVLRLFYKVVLNALPNSGTALDLGCGIGDLTRAISLKGLKVVGIDSSEEMIKIAIGKSTQLNSSEFIISSIEDFINKNNDKYDLIVAFKALHHLPITSIRETIKIVFDRCLKTGGKLVIVDLFTQSTIFKKNGFYTRFLFWIDGIRCGLNTLKVNGLLKLPWAYFNDFRVHSHIAWKEHLKKESIPIWSEWELISNACGSCKLERISPRMIKIICFKE